MSFGKRTPTATSPTARSSAGRWLALCALFAGAVVVYLTYANRQELAARIYPAALDHMALADHQIAHGWREDLPDAQLGEAATRYMLGEMIALCRNPRHLAYNQASNQLLSRQPPVAEDVSAVRTVYGDGEVSAGARIAQIKADARHFCAKEYPVAFHDGRHASVVYGARLLNINKKMIRRLDSLKALANSRIEKLKRGEVLSPEEEAVGDCIHKYEAELERVTSCFWELMLLRGKIPQDEIADLKAGLAMQPHYEELSREAEERPTAMSRNSDSYSSPTVDYRAYCQRVHKDNYEYREICERNQEEAKNEIRSMNVPAEIARYCDRVHSESYEYRKICYENQIAAKARNSY